jgi:DNA-binding response OmpR family regulator
MKKILVVDDCSSIRAYLKKLAWQWDFDVIATEDGNVALEEMQKEDAPKILFIDWMMPIMDGMELIRKIRALPTDTTRYIIVMTAKSEPKDIEEGFAAGADDYLIKPLDQNELRARIGEAERVIFREELIKKAVASR